MVLPALRPEPLEVRYPRKGPRVKIRKEKIDPICPYCEKKMKHLVEIDRGLFSVNRIFCCPHCQKVLGLSAGVQ